MALTEFPPISALDSTSHKILLAEAEIAGIDVEVLRDILWLIVAHDHLIALPVAAQRILEILRIAPETWQPALDEAGILRWGAALKWVIKNKKTLTARIGQHFGRIASKSWGNPINGYGITQFPMYAVLCEHPPYSESNSLHFIRLSGHLLVAHALAMQDNSTRIEFEQTNDKRDWKPLPNSIAAAALAVRRTAGGSENHHLHELPTDLPPEEFAEELERLPPSRSWQQGEDRVPLYRFLQKAWGLLDWLEKTGGGGGGSGGHESVGGRLEVGGRLTIEKLPIGDLDDQSSDWGTSKIVKITTVSPRKKKLHLEIDLSPDEDADDEEILLSGFDCSITKKDPGSLARAARAKARHIALENQLFPWAYDILADEEVVDLLLAIRREVAAMRTDEIPTLFGATRAKYEMFCLIQVMLWTGRNVASAASINICGTHSSSEKPLFGIIVSNAKNVRWQIPALTPEYQTTIDDHISELRELRKNFELPDQFELAELFRPLANGNSLDAAPLFQTDIQTLEKLLREWLKRYSPDGRVTVTKISNMLWRKLFNEFGDPAIVSCITGQMHHLARVRLFYTTPKISMLQEIYLSVTQRIAGLFNTALGHEQNANEGFSPPEPPRPQPSGAVGARMCPSHIAVRTYVSRLKEALSTAARYSDRGEFCRYHNLYTLYTLQFFAYATTCRAIVTPYLELEQINPTRRIAPLSDKDDEFAHKTRLIWIPDALLQQMQFYAMHIDALRSQLNCPKNSSYREPCFFLDPEFKPVAARPKEIEKHLQEFIRIRANSHRRFLRTELIERRCPPEVVDAFLGHWQQGEEPYGLFSSFSAKRYVETLRVFLDPLLNEIGMNHAIASKIAQ